MADQQSGCAGEFLGELVDARLLAVHDTEPVGHEGIAERRELLREVLAVALILGRLVRVEPQVLEQRDVTVRQPLDGLVRCGADGVCR